MDKAIQELNEEIGKQQRIQQLQGDIVRLRLDLSEAYRKGNSTSSYEIRLEDKARELRKLGGKPY